MTETVIDFASKKRKTIRDNLDWSPRDCLLEALEDLDAGRWAPDSIFLIGCKNHENGAIKELSDYRAGATRERELALIEHAKKRLMDGW